MKGWCDLSRIAFERSYAIIAQYDCSARLAKPLGHVRSRVGKLCRNANRINNPFPRFARNTNKHMWVNFGENGN